MSMTDIKIRCVPSNANPTPRPSTPGKRPGTSSGGGSSSHGLKPFSDDDPCKSVFEDMITEDYLQQIAGVDDLKEVTSIKLEIDTSYQSILDLGDMMRRLDHLTLDTSKILSIRDLGVGLKYLVSLSVNDCKLSELDGIGMLTSLKTLSARDNSITDVTALAMHEAIESVDLHGNQLTDISVGDELSSCPCLHHLVLSGNSIGRAPKYRLVMAAMIPQLLTLDGVQVDKDAVNKVSNGMILEAASAMQLEQEELDDERRMEMMLLQDDMFFGETESNRDSNPTLSLPSGCMSASDHLPDTGSDLTHGSAVVLAGSMASAIRKRRGGSGLGPPCGQTHVEASHGSGNSSSGVSSSKSNTTTSFSTLEALDSALHNNGDLYNETKPSIDGEYYSEGDITKIVKKQMKAKVASSPKHSQYRKKNAASHAHNHNSAAHISSSFDPEPGTNLSNNSLAAALGHRESSSPSVSASGIKHPEGWASRPLSRHNSRSSIEMGKGNINSQASPGGQQYRDRDPPVWQKNASRPPSTISTSDDYDASTEPFGIAVGLAPSAPFKVAHRPTPEVFTISDTPESQKRNQNIPGANLHHLRCNQAESDTHLELRVRQARGRGTDWEMSDDDSHDDSEDEELIHPSVQARKLIGLQTQKSPTKGTDKFGIGSGSRGKGTIVDRGAVTRGLLFNNDTNSNIDVNDKGSSAAVVEDINHSSPQRRSQDNSVSLFHGSCPLPPTAAVPPSLFMSMSSSLPMENGNSNVTDNSNIQYQESGINLSEAVESASSQSGALLANVAGRSLGFDLKGSLAAINQWVDDQDSEEEDDEEDYDDDTEKKFKFSSSLSSGTTSGMWSMRKDMQRASTAQKKILSRNTILHMCTGTSSGNGHDQKDMMSSLVTPLQPPKPKARYRPTEPDSASDDQASDCEENEVFFYDNNIQKGEGDGVDNHSQNAKTTISRLRVDTSKQPKTKAGSSSSCDSMGQQDEMFLSNRGNSNSNSNDTRAKHMSNHNQNYSRSHCSTPSTNTDDRDVSGTVSAAASTSPSTHEKETDTARVTQKQPLLQEPTGSSTTSRNSNLASGSGSTRTLEVNLTQSGAALLLTDSQLITMLGLAPKAVPHLKTKSGFQDFFRGMQTAHMQRLLEVAYQDMNALDREHKVKKRMELLTSVLVAS